MGAFGAHLLRQRSKIGKKPEVLRLVGS